MVKYHLVDGYRFAGYKTYKKANGTETNPNARIINLKRIQKKRNVPVAASLIRLTMTGKGNGYGICHVATSLFTSNSNGVECGANIPAW